MEPKHRSRDCEAEPVFDGSVIRMFGDKIKRQNQLISRMKAAVAALPPECKARLAAHLERQEHFDEQEAARED